MLNTVKLALRITTSAYDTELQQLINAALADLELVGVAVDATDPLIIRCVIMYVRAFFGSPGDYERVKAAYDEMKAQFISATGYGLGADDVQSRRY